MKTKIISVKAYIVTLQSISNGKCVYLKHRHKKKETHRHSKALGKKFAKNLNSTENKHYSYY